MGPKEVTEPNIGITRETSTRLRYGTQYGGEQLGVAMKFL